MAGNLPILAMPTVPSGSGGFLYIVKDDEDYKITVDGANGIALYNSSGKIPAANLTLDWNEIINKPLTFTPAAHVHDAADITTGVLDPARLPDVSPTSIEWSIIQNEPIFTQRWPTYAEVTGKPTTFTPSSHTHSTADIVSGTFDNARIAQGNVTQHQGALTITWGQISGEPVYTTRWPTWNEVSGKPAVVTDGGTQTIDGAKTFTSSITAPDFISTSDAALKTNIEYIEPRKDMADQLSMTKYFQKEANQRGRGPIAQDVLKHFPEYTSVREDGFLGVNMTGLLYETVLGLARRVKELEEKLANGPSE